MSVWIVLPAITKAGMGKSWRLNREIELKLKSSAYCHPGSTKGDDT
jgi:hypothetical protein